MMELINKDNISSLCIGDLLYKVTFDKCVEVVFDGVMDDGMCYYDNEWNNDRCESVRIDCYVHISDLDDLNGSIVFYRGVRDSKSLINARIGLLQREINRLNKSLYGPTLPL
jgi:hypothetical protein